MQNNVIYCLWIHTHGHIHTYIIIRTTYVVICTMFKNIQEEDKYQIQEQRLPLGREGSKGDWRHYFFKIKRWGFPGGAVVKNPPANAGDTGSIPGPGRSHMPRSNWARAPQLLSLPSRTREPQLLKPSGLEPMLRNKRSHRNEKPAHCNRVAPTRRNQRKPARSNKDPMQPKVK